MQSSVTFSSGEEIDQREAGVGILQKYWKAFAPRDVREWGERIANSNGDIAAAYVGNVIAGILEGIRVDVGGDPSKVATTFQELTGEGTWHTNRTSGDTVVLVDLTVAPEYRGAGLFEAFVDFARKTLKSPSGVILTYSPLFMPRKRYCVVQKHQNCGAKLVKEFPRSRPGLTMTVGEDELTAEDVGITAYSV